MKKIYLILIAIFIKGYSANAAVTPYTSSVTTCNHSAVNTLSVTFNFGEQLPAINGCQGWRYQIKADAAANISANSYVIVDIYNWGGGSGYGSAVCTFRLSQTTRVYPYGQLQYKTAGVWHTYKTQSRNIDPYGDGAYSTNFILYFSNSATSFYVNNTQQTGTDPATFYKCINTDALSLSPSTYGSISKYQIKLEKGLWSGGVFTNLATYTSSELTSTTIPSSTNLDLLFTPNLNSYTGYIRVSLTTKGESACGSTAVTKVQMFKVESNTANLNFQLNGSGCLGGNNNRRTTLPIPDQTFSSSPCIPD